MDWQPTTANQGGVQRKHAKWVSQEVRQQRIKAKLCLRCGAGDHIAPGCPYLPPSRRPSPVRAAKAVALPELEDEDTAETLVNGESGKE